MEVEKQELENGFIFRISGEKPAGLLVRKGSTERIYLPRDATGNNSTYYVEGDSPASSAYEFYHPGSFDEYEVLDSSSL